MRIGPHNKNIMAILPDRDLHLPRHPDQMSNEELLKPVLETIKWPVYYDQGSQFVFDQDGRMICDIRGWGWIQKLGPDAGAMQDALGQNITDHINSLKP